MINNRQNNRRRGRGGGGGARPNGGNAGGSRIDNRARGNASQLYEKYKTLARDMQTQGDRVMTEYYLQFADHYYRILNENRPRVEEQQRRVRDEGEDGADETEVMAAADAEDGVETAGQHAGDTREDEGRGRLRRGRPSRDAFESAADPAGADGDQIEIDRLPPAFAVNDVDGTDQGDDEAGDEGDDARPRRRGRRPKSESAAAE